MKGYTSQWEIDGETVETVSDFILLGSKITADGDCRYEIKRHLLLWRKVLTNLDRVLKSRDIILLTKVYRVNVMVFPVVMYRCESWTIKMAECWRIDFLRVPGTARRSNQSILKDINPEYSLEGLMLKLKLQPPVVKSCLIRKDPDTGKDWGQEEEGVAEDGTVGWHHQLSRHKFEQTPQDSERQGSVACCSSQGLKDSDTTWPL